MAYPNTAIAEDAVWNASATKHSPTTHALQVELRKTGYYTTAYLLDGKFGPATIKAWQRYLRDKGRYAGKYTGLIDGQVGNMTISAACSFLSADGGNVYTGNKIYYGRTNGPTTFPEYYLSLAWQNYLNDRRNK